MKKRLTKTEAQEEINDFFARKEFSPEEVKKIKRLAMKFNIKLKKHRQNFCKKCLTKLRGKTRISKTQKTIECEKCHFLNRFKIG